MKYCAAHIRSLFLMLVGTIIVAPPVPAIAMQQDDPRQVAGQMLDGTAEGTRTTPRSSTLLDYRARRAGDEIVLAPLGRFSPAVAADRRDGPRQVGVHRGVKSG